MISIRGESAPVLIEAIDIPQKQKSQQCMFSFDACAVVPTILLHATHKLDTKVQLDQKQNSGRLALARYSMSHGSALHHNVSRTEMHEQMSPCVSMARTSCPGMTLDVPILTHI